MSFLSVLHDATWDVRYLFGGGTFLNSEEFQGLGLKGRRIRLCKNELSSSVSYELPSRFPM